MGVPRMRSDGSRGTPRVACIRGSNGVGGVEVRGFGAADLGPASSAPAAASAVDASRRDGSSAAAANRPGRHAAGVMRAAAIDNADLEAAAARRADPWEDSRA